MNEGACDQSQFACGLWIVVCVVFDERFIDCFGAIFLADQIEDFGASQVALEFVGVLFDFAESAAARSNSVMASV